MNKHQRYAGEIRALLGNICRVFADERGLLIISDVALRFQYSIILVMHVLPVDEKGSKTCSHRVPIVGDLLEPNGLADIDQI